LREHLAELARRDGQVEQAVSSEFRRFDAPSRARRLAYAAGSARSPRSSARWRRTLSMLLVHGLSPREFAQSLPHSARQDASVLARRANPMIRTGSGNRFAPCRW
jgi:hypothetical protein